MQLFLISIYFSLFIFKFTKSPVWSVDALEQLRWECRDQVYHNLSIWEPQLGRRHGTPPLAILSSLCLNNCTGVGSCENGITFSSPSSILVVLVING